MGNVLFCSFYDEKRKETRGKKKKKRMMKQVERAPDAAGCVSRPYASSSFNSRKHITRQTRKMMMMAAIIIICLRAATT